MQRQSACFQTMSCLKYLIEAIHTLITAHGNGTYWRTYVKDGDKSSLHHHAVSTSEFAAQTKLLSRRTWVSGQPSLSLLIMAVPGKALGQTMKTMSLLLLSTPIVYVFSCLVQRARSGKSWPR